MVSVRAALIWAGLTIAIIAPMAIAATSPLLVWRDRIYIGAGFAGMIAMALMLVQPLLAAGWLPGLPVLTGRRVHRWLGVTLVLLVLVHVAGLWVTSPPDAIDALLFNSPTPFSIWGVLAMWAVFGAAALAVLRGRRKIGPKVWRIGHSVLAVVIVIGSVLHALLVEGVMEPISKAAFCGLVVAATAKVLLDLRAWTLLMRKKR